MSTLRVGLGWDAHPLKEGKRLVLGGVEIPHGCGLSGHSDADVVVHALMDALLGAAGLGDIGQHFPASDPAYLGASSLTLLRRVRHMLHDWTIVNLDAVVVAREPVLQPFFPLMRESIAGALDITPGQVSIKGKNSEGVGFVGRREGMAAYAVVLLKRENHKSETRNSKSENPKSEARN